MSNAACCPRLPCPVDLLAMRSEEHGSVAFVDTRKCFWYADCGPQGEESTVNNVKERLITKDVEERQASWLRQGLQTEGEVGDAASSLSGVRSWTGETFKDGTVCTQRRVVASRGV